MHPSHGPFFNIKGYVCLCNDRLQPMCLKFFLAEGAPEETPRIFATLNIDDIRTLELRLSENHYNSSSTNIRFYSRHDNRYFQRHHLIPSPISAPRGTAVPTRYMCDRGYYV